MKKVQNIQHTISLWNRLFHCGKIVAVTLLLSAGTIAVAQDNNSNINAPTQEAQQRYDNIPVSAYSGSPDISIPLVSLPTRMTDLSYDLRLNYSIANVAAKDMGSDMGQGWGMATTGVISRTIPTNPDEYRFKNNPNVVGSTLITRALNTYHYSVMGYTGSFIVELGMQNVPYVEIIKNSSGGVVKIEFEPGADFTINSFTLYNDKGYKFIFAAYDRVTKDFGGLGPLFITYRSAFYLTEIVDNNNVQVAQFDYSTYNEPTLYSITLPTIPEDMLRKIKKVTVPGKGTVDFDFSLYPRDPNLRNDRFTINSLTVTDFKKGPVKKYTFSHSISYDNKWVLRKVEESNFQNAKVRKHEFLYNALSSENRTLVEPDRFGYYKLRKPACPANFQFDTDPVISKIGALKKILLPSGGAIIFDFEPHTYSYNGMNAYNDEEFYYDNHNYRNPQYAFHDFGNDYANIWEFDVTGSAKTLYFNVVIPPRYVDGLGNPGGNNAVYAQLNLYSDNGLVGNLSEMGNYENGCLGRKFTLPPGHYSILKSSITGLTNNNESVTIVEHLRETVLKKWHYGGGLRIGKIAYFDNGNVPFNYYDNPIFANTYKPVKEITYNYNFFDEPNRSSGSVAISGDLYISAFGIPHEVVGYKNVTVTETGNNGKTQHTYISPMDLPQSYIDNAYLHNYYDYKRGLNLNDKVLNAAGQVLSEASSTYEFVETADPPAWSNHGKTGWVDKKFSTTKNYFYGAGTASTVESTENLFFDPTNRQIMRKTVSSEKPGETLTTVYIYFYADQAYARNRISDLMGTETYRNTERIGTTATIYGNNWQGNTVWLPQQLQSATGGLGLETRKRYSQYDSYSNPLESATETGLKTSYIWGYKGSTLLAVVQNASYTQISSYVPNLQALSDTGTEVQLRTALNAMRTALATSLPTAQVTTYTHWPLIGPLTITDPKGLTTTYEYDEFQRLTLVRDPKGYILSENQYNNKTN